jgi:hypothetical protein
MIPVRAPPFPVNPSSSVPGFVDPS